MHFAKVKGHYYKYESYRFAGEVKKRYYGRAYLLDLACRIERAIFRMQKRLGGKR